MALSTVWAITYGIVHDQVTARACVEYFTVAHPPVFDTEDPTLLGLGWGVYATWWVGAILGLFLAVSARGGPLPKRDARSLTRPAAIFLALLGVAALLADVVGYLLARGGFIVVVGSLADDIPRERHAAFLADLWAHSASCLGGFVGGAILVVKVRRSRRPPAVRPAGEGPSGS